MNENYFEHKTKTVEADNNFKHVMAITLDPRTHYKEGIIRCIISREGDLETKGYVDRSELHIITGDSLEQFKIGEKLNIKNEDKIIGELVKEGGDFIGLEDPDIWIDEATNLMHVYFTIPIRNKHTTTHLGHAVGESLDSLEMTMPVLMGGEGFRAKEVSIAPINTKGFHYNLIESKDRQIDASYSVVQVAITEDMGRPWQYGDIVFHPKEHNILGLLVMPRPGHFFQITLLMLVRGSC